MSDVALSVFSSFFWVCQFLTGSFIDSRKLVVFLNFFNDFFDTDVCSLFFIICFPLFALGISYPWFSGFFFFRYMCI